MPALVQRAAWILSAQLQYRRHGTELTTPLPVPAILTTQLLQPPPLQPDIGHERRDILFEGEITIILIEARQIVITITRTSLAICLQGAR